MPMEAFIYMSHFIVVVIIFFSVITISWPSLVKWFHGSILLAENKNIILEAGFLSPDWRHPFHWVGFSNFSLFPFVTPSLLTLPYKLIPLPMWLILSLLTPLCTQSHLFEFPSVSHYLGNTENGNGFLYFILFSWKIILPMGLLRRGFGLFKGTQYSQTCTKSVPDI